MLVCSDDSFTSASPMILPAGHIEHNDGKGADWTASRRPVHLVWFEKHPTLSSARQRENQLKRWSRGKKHALVGSSRLQIFRSAKNLS
jgi:putative endonuclease